MSSPGAHRDPLARTVASDNDPAWAVLATALWLLPPLVVLVWALLGPVAANPENPPDRRGLLGLMRLALDSDLPGVALLSGATFAVFAAALVVAFAVVTGAADLLASHARRSGSSAGASAMPVGGLRGALTAVQVLTGVGIVTAAVLYVTIVRDPLIDPVWTSLLLVGGGAFLVWACGRGRAALGSTKP